MAAFQAGTIHIKKKTSVPNADAGWIRVYVGNDGNLYNIDESGSIGRLIESSEVASISGNLQSQIDSKANSSSLSNYTLLSTTSSISGDLQVQIDSLVLNSTTVSSTGGSIIVSLSGSNYNLEVASSPIQNHNDLHGLQGSGNDYYHLNATQFASISGGIDLSAYTPLATTASISGDLQNQINNKQNNITLIAGSNVSIVESPNDTWTISASGGSGSVDLSAYTPLATTASISGDLQTQINEKQPIEFTSYDNGSIRYTDSNGQTWRDYSSIILIGVSSGATARVIVTTGTTSGYIALREISGDFIVGETVTVTNMSVEKSFTVAEYEKKVNTVEIITTPSTQCDIACYNAPDAFSEWVRDSGNITSPGYYFWSGQNKQYMFLSSGFNSDITIEKSFAGSHQTANQATLGFEGSPFQISVAGSPVLDVWGTSETHHYRRSTFSNTIEQNTGLFTTSVSTRKIASANSVTSTTDYDPIAHSTNFGTIKYICQLTDGTNIRSSEIIASFSGSTVNFNEINILQPVGAITNATWSVVATGGNIVIRLSITSGTYNVRISREHIQ